MERLIYSFLDLFYVSNKRKMYKITVTCRLNKFNSIQKLVLEIKGFFIARTKAVTLRKRYDQVI